MTQKIHENPTAAFVKTDLFMFAVVWWQVSWKGREGGGGGSFLRLGDPRPAHLHRNPQNNRTTEQTIIHHGTSTRWCPFHKPSLPSCRFYTQTRRRFASVEEQRMSSVYMYRTTPPSLCTPWYLITMLAPCEVYMICGWVAY